MACRDCASRGHGPIIAWSSMLDGDDEEVSGSRPLVWWAVVVGLVIGGAMAGALVTVTLALGHPELMIGFPVGVALAINWKSITKRRRQSNGRLI
jgi:hypothetical protein